MFTCKRLTPCSPVGRDKAADTTVSKIRTPLHASQAQSPTHSSSSHESTRWPAQALQARNGVLSVGGRGAAAAVRPAAVLGQTAAWWCGYNRAWYKRAKLGAGRCEGKSACLVLQLCSLCARRGICALRLCTWLCRCRRRCARRVLSRLNTFYTRSTSPLPMASSHSGPHVYPASLQPNVAGECSGSSLSLLCGLYAIYGDDFQKNQVGGLRLDMLNVRGHYTSRFQPLALEFAIFLYTYSSFSTMLVCHHFMNCLKSNI